MGRLDGKIALVLGAGSRFGRAVAVALAREGATIAVGCGDEATGGATDAAIAAEGGRSQHVLLDPTDEASSRAAVEATLTTFGRIDVLVTRIVSPPRTRRTLADVAADEWADTVRHVLLAAVHPIRAALPTMLEKGGSVVVIGSNAGIVGSSDMPAFASATAGLLALTRSLSAEAQARGGSLRVNYLALDHLAASQPPPEDAIPAVLRLATDDGRGVTGQVIAPDGNVVAMGGK
jgi:NAD(P)-dependent dehydrogenase (short-subunit alcohol dehydrogenase family)